MNTRHPSTAHRLKRAGLVAMSALIVVGCDSAPGDARPGARDTAEASLTDRVKGSVGALFGDADLPPIKGLTLGMPIEEAVRVMNEKAGPIWAQTLGKPAPAPFKVMRISGEHMAQLRLQLIQLVSAATMQLYRVDPADTRDLFIVVPSTAPDTPDDLKAIGMGVLQSVLFTGFFAWADADGKVNLFIIGPTLCNALFDASFMPMEQFAAKFGDAYEISKWQTAEEPGTGKLFLYESAAGPSVALTEDPLMRRTVVVWDSKAGPSVGTPGQGAFD
jgi:hypothetical protein